MKERPIIFNAPMVRALLAGKKTQTRRVVKLPHQNPLGQWGPITMGGPGGGRTSEGNEVPAHGCIGHSRTGEIISYPNGQIGDQLWVREAYSGPYECTGAPPREWWSGVPIWYWADGNPEHGDWTKPKPGMHMPRWASRITLEITDVRVQRLQDISEADARAEGCEASPFPGPCWQGYRKAEDGYLLQQQAVGKVPPDWMFEPRPMRPVKHLDISAIAEYRLLWAAINGHDSWDKNPWVWAISFERVKP